MFTTGKLAAALALHPDTIRRYEKQGLIPEAQRSPLNGYRLWSDEDLETIRRNVFGEEPSKEEVSESDAG